MLFLICNFYLHYLEGGEFITWFYDFIMSLKLSDLAIKSPN